MRITTSPVRVIYRGTYSNDGDREPIRYKSGKLVEFVKLIDEETGDLLDNWTLGENINGELQAGDVVVITAEVRSELKAGRSQSGREYVTTKYKYRVTDARAASGNGAAKAAS
jgi:hypothetical protein